MLLQRGKTSEQLMAMQSLCLLCPGSAWDTDCLPLGHTASFGWLGTLQAVTLWLAGL